MSAWTDIATARIDADSPVDEDLSGDINDNDKSIRERQLRCGTHTTGVRLALARNVTTFNITLDGSGNGSDQNAVTFSTAAADGNPNFSAAPTCLGFTLEESTVAGDEIGTPTGISVRLDEGSVSATGFTSIVTVRGGSASVTIDYKLHWAFVGPVTSGE